ncbi:hypothetical protein LL912_00760 [Niabella sp. CC-SYL272]|uniref:DUF7352 domain-containing protein n=1 Tax=Niabella agricola TaxID=2891571 RepID=UPI001F278B23|nr:hypothetical protein [Niabella agricola]MCF3107297.1 hypothetical protein [Niabella agricola]
MKAIYKYPIPVQEKYAIELPKDAQIIRVEDVDGLFFLWAIVETDPDHPTEKRCLEFYKTGQPIETPTERLRFLGTCKLFIMQELCLYVFENFYETNTINNYEVRS